MNHYRLIKRPLSEKIISRSWKAGDRIRNHHFFLTQHIFFILFLRFDCVWRPRVVKSIFSLYLHTYSLWLYINLRVRWTYCYIIYYNLHMVPWAHSDWSKTHFFYLSTKHSKSVFYCFSPHYLYIIKRTRKPRPCITLQHSGHLRTLEKCWKHSPAARVFYILINVFYIPLVSSNVRRVLWQCNTRLRLLFIIVNLLLCKREQITSQGFFTR